MKKQAKPKEKQQTDGERHEEMERINQALARIQKATRLKVLQDAKEYFNTMQPNGFTRGR